MVIEPVEALPAPGKWTGDDPDEAVDKVLPKCIAQTGEKGGEGC